MDSKDNKELENAKKVLELSDDEKNAIFMYQGSKHTAINILLSLDKNDRDELSKKGWKLADTKEEFKEDIDKFINMYSAIYKDFTMSRDAKKFAGRTLYRGTSTKRASSLKEKNTSFLSTSRNEDIAKTFVEYGDAAIIRIKVDENVPCLDVNKYRDLESVKDEKEILISPFAKVKNNNFSSKYLGYSFYDAELVHQDLEEVDKKELESLKKETIDKYEEFLKRSKAYNEKIAALENRKRLYDRAKGDRQEQKDIMADYEKIENESYEDYKYIRDYSSKLRRFLEGSCKEKELEVDKAYQIVKDEKLKEIQETKKQIQYDTLNYNIDGVIEKGNKFMSDIQKSYNEILSDNQKIAEKYYKLDLQSTELDPINLVEELMYDMNKTINVTNEKMNARKVDINDSSVTPKQVLNTENKLKVQSTLYGSLDTSGFKRYANNYRDAKKQDMKKDIYKKVQNMVNRAKRAQLKDLYKTKSEEKIGFFGKLFGKEKLKEAELENLTLKIKELDVPENSDAKSTNNYSVRNSLAELYKTMYIDLPEKYTKEINIFYDIAASEFGMNTDIRQSEIAELAKQKSFGEKSLVVISEGTKDSTRRRYDKIIDENDKIKYRIKQKREENKKDRFFDSSSVGASCRQMRDCINSFNRVLKNSVFLMTSKNKQKEQDKEIIIDEAR